MFGRYRPGTQLRIKLSTFGLVEKLHTEESWRTESFTVRIHFFNVTTERTLPVINAKNRLETGVIYPVFFMFFCDETCENFIIIAPFERLLPDLSDFMQFPFRDLCEEINRPFLKAFTERLPVFAKAELERIYFQQEFKYNQFVEGNLFSVQQGLRHILHRGNHPGPTLVGELLVK